METLKFKQPSQKRYMENLEDFGDYIEFPGSSPEENLKLHPRAEVKYGGLIMPDDEGVIPQFAKDLASRIAKKLMKG